MNAKDVECMKGAIQRFQPHIVLGESAYMPIDAKLGLESKYEELRRRKDQAGVSRMFGGTNGTTTLSGLRIDVSRPIIELCVANGIHFMYDESWADKRTAVRRIAENRASGDTIKKAIFLFLNGRVEEAITAYRAVIRQRIEGLVERDENSNMVVTELFPILPQLNGTRGLEEVRILNRIGIYHLGRFERLKADERFETTCSFETTPPMFGRLGVVMAKGSLGSEVTLDDEFIMWVMVNDLVMNQFDVMNIWSPLFVGTVSMLADMLEGERLRGFGMAYAAIARATRELPEPIRTAARLHALSEYFGVPVPVNEEQMGVFVRERIAGFRAKRMEFGADVDLRQIVSADNR